MTNIFEDNYGSPNVQHTELYPDVAEVNKRDTESASRLVV